MAKTSSFVTEIPLKATVVQVVALNKRLEAARQVYNACLGEGLKRLNLMRQSKAWQKARSMPKGDAKSDDPIKQQQAKDRADAFGQCWKDFDLEGKYSLQEFAQQFSRQWMGDHLGSQLIKAIATKAFVWMKEYTFDSKRGRPRFRRYGSYNSVESGYIGKEFLFEGIQGQYVFSWTVGRVWDSEEEKFGQLGPVIKLGAIIDPKDEVMQHGLNSRLKYVRLIRRELNGKTRFYAQLVCEGKPYQRHKLGGGVVGLDIGPSTIAIVSNSEAQLKRFCDELKDSQKEIRKLQRKIDRQRRAGNPDNYEPNWWVYPKGQKPRLKKGKVKQGPKRWIKSKAQLKNEQRLAEIKRRQREYRKSLHGKLVNTILQMGDVIKLEKLSYRAFQKMFGKSVGMRAPGMFVARLRQKIGDAGGLIDEFSTYNTKLSQRCHGCGQIVKKPLSQRWHKCECGVIAQRDLYSAFLATCVEDGEFNALIAHEQWAGLGSALQAALDDMQTGDGLPASFGLKQRPEPEPVV